jgi:hypothetical protein
MDVIVQALWAFMVPVSEFRSAPGAERALR